MSPAVRQFSLIVHLVCSVGWIGAVIAYLVLGVCAATSVDVRVVGAAWIAMELSGWYAIVPLAIGSLVTGLITSATTPWGLFRHYWVLLTLALTLFCVAILLLHMPSVSARAQIASAGGSETLGHLGGDLLHPGLGLVVLLVVMGLNVYKPRGLTRYGWRKQREERG